jgi:hypothetical protein
LQAFQVSIFPTQKAAFSVHLQMVPKYDPATSRWTPTSPEEEASAGYSPIGSLIRQGPSPFIQRVTDSDSYDQGVLKMMSKDKMSRNEAQGNMDAYIRNVSDKFLHCLFLQILHSFSLFDFEIVAKRLGAPEIGREKRC